MMKQFGVSTHLYHGERLHREHLIEIAAHGFEAVEVFATRSHFDYHDTAAIQALAEWLHDGQLQLHSVHAPIVDSLVNDKWGRAYSTATRDSATAIAGWVPGYMDTARAADLHARANSVSAVLWSTGNVPTAGGERVTWCTARVTKCAQLHMKGSPRRLIYRGFRRNSAGSCATFRLR